MAELPSTDKAATANVDRVREILRDAMVLMMRDRFLRRGRSTSVTPKRGDVFTMLKSLPDRRAQTSTITLSDTPAAWGFSLKPTRQAPTCGPGFP